MPASRRFYSLAGVRVETLQLKPQVRIVLRQLIFVMDFYGASIISGMQPDTTSQGRIRDTPV
jgi:hypothetical protein